MSGQFCALAMFYGYPDGGKGFQIKTGMESREMILSPGFLSVSRYGSTEPFLNYLFIARENS